MRLGATRSVVGAADGDPGRKPSESSSDDDAAAAAKAADEDDSGGGRAASAAASGPRGFFLAASLAARVCFPCCACSPIFCSRFSWRIFMLCAAAL